MRRFYVLLPLLLLVLAACENEPAPPPEPQQPVVQEPTAQEVKAEIIKTLDPFKPLFAPDQEPLPQPIHMSTLQSLRATIAKLQPGSNGPEGITMAQRQIENMLSQAEQAEQWAAVVAMCDALEVIDPDTTRTKRARQEAMIQLNRPKVAIKGFMEDVNAGKTIVLMRVRIPATGEVIPSVQAEVGEEFLPKPYTLRLVDIIGDNRGVNLEYKATGDTFQVYTRRAQSLL